MIIVKIFSVLYETDGPRASLQYTIILSLLGRNLASPYFYFFHESLLLVTLYVFSVGFCKYLTNEKYEKRACDPLDPQTVGKTL